MLDRVDISPRRRWRRRRAALLPLLLLSACSSESAVDGTRANAGAECAARSGNCDAGVSAGNGNVSGVAAPQAVSPDADGPGAVASTPRGSDASTPRSSEENGAGPDPSQLPASPQANAEAPSEACDATATGCAACRLAQCTGDVQQLAAGDYHTCALLAGGAIKCWGYNDRGQLGQGDTLERGRGTGLDPGMGAALPPVNLGNVPALSLAAGADHSCALFVGGAVKCWGYNDRGQLGQGDVLSRGNGAPEDPGMGEALAAIDLGSGRTALAIAAGARHTCALLDDRSVKCWGDNARGQLGQGDTLARGTGSDTDPGMGDALAPVQLGEDRSAVAIAAGADHSCALLDDGAVKCWGFNTFGQLGQGDDVNRGSGLPQGAEMGDALDPVELGPSRKALSISAGYAHTCVILDDESVKCWGRNRYGQLGQGDTLDRNGSGPAEDAGSAEQLLPVELGAGRPVAVVAAKGHHTCALLADGSAKCWGHNRYGQLAQGDTVARGTGADTDPGMGEALRPVALGTQRRVLDVAAGALHTCFMLDDRSLKCCGSNAVGQLGYGDPFDRCKGDADYPMGDELSVVRLR